MTTRTFGKCLKHALRTPDGAYRYYFLPYTGNLTDKKFEELGARLMAHIGHFYPSIGLIDYVVRLKSEWLTGREKNVTIKLEERGTYSLGGENWWSWGMKQDDFAVLDETPVYSDCESSVTAE